MSQYRPTGKIDISNEGYIEMKPFPPGFEKALYHADLSVNGHEFSGLMMIKAFEDGTYKVAFFNELGLNFFDFALIPRNNKSRLGLVVNNIYSPLDRKILLNSLEKYFNMLLGPLYPDEPQKSFLKKDGSMVMIRLGTYRGNDAYFSRNLIEPYSEILNLSKITCNDRIAITLSQNKVNFSPESIHINQPGMKLVMELTLVE